MQNKNVPNSLYNPKKEKDQQGKARLLMMFCRFCDMMIQGSKGQKIFYTNQARLPASIVQGNKRQVANIRLIIYSTGGFIMDK